MKIDDIPLKKITKTIKKAAKKVYGNKARIGKKGRTSTAIYIRITVIAYLVLYKLTPKRLAAELREDRKLREFLELPWPIGDRTIREWRKKLGKLVRRLIRKTFEVLARVRKVKKDKAIVDTTGFSRGRASKHYEARIGRKKKMYAKALAIYSVRVDAVYDIGVDYDSKHDTKMLEGKVDDIVESGFFDGVIGDKGFDSGPLMEKFLKHGVQPYIAVRGGKLEPRGGVRLISRRNFESLRAGAGNVGSLVESLFGSVKSLCGEVVYSHCLEGFATEIAVRFLAYNVAVIIKLKLRRLEI